MTTATENRRKDRVRTHLHASLNALWQALEETNGVDEYDALIAAHEATMIALRQFNDLG